MKRTAIAAVVLAVGLSAGAAETTYKVDPVHSSVNFRVKHMGTSYAHGRFNAVEGKFALDDADPSKSSFEVKIKAASVDTNHKIRDGHLTGPDLFNAKQYPTISFKSTKVSPGTDGTSMSVTGDLTFHGVTKPIIVKMEKVGTGKGMKGEALAGVESEFVIKRSDFGVKAMTGMLGEDVRVTVSLEGVKS